MRVGKLRHKIQILAISNTQNEYNEPEQTESIFKEVFAEIKPISGGEKFLANGLYPEATESFRIRYLAGLDTTMKIQFGTRKFDIQNIQNIEERNKELFIIAKEIFI